MTIPHDGSCRRSRSRFRRIAVGVLVAVLSGVGGVMLIVASAVEAPAAAHADALCDQMRAQYGPSWPCISVPTYSPPPTMNTPAPTAIAPGDTSTGGPQVGSNAGPGPGDGDGTPIAPTSPQTQPEAQTGAPSPTATRPPLTSRPMSSPSQPSAVSTPSPTTDPDTRSDTPQPAQHHQNSTTIGGRPRVSVGVSALRASPDAPETGIPAAVWLLVGAAALAVGTPQRLRSILTGPASITPAQAVDDARLATILADYEATHTVPVMIDGVVAALPDSTDKASIRQALHDGVRYANGYITGIRFVVDDLPEGTPQFPLYPNHSLSGRETRIFYLNGDKAIRALSEQLDDEDLPVEARARILFEMRNALRSKARDLMADSGTAEDLRRDEPNKTWDEMVAHKRAKLRAKGLDDSDDAVYEDIAKTSSTSRGTVNDAYGFDPDNPPPMTPIEPEQLAPETESPQPAPSTDDSSSAESEGYSPPAGEQSEPVGPESDPQTSVPNPPAVSDPEPPPAAAPSENSTPAEPPPFAQCTPDDPDGNGVPGYQGPNNDGHGGTNWQPQSDDSEHSPGRGGSGPTSDNEGIIGEDGQPESPQGPDELPGGRAPEELPEGGILPEIP